VTPLSFNVAFLLSREPDRVSAQTLYHQKLESMPEICAADSMCLSLLLFTQLLSEVAEVSASQTGAKTEFDAK